MSHPAPDPQRRPRCLRLHPEDNVAVMLANVTTGCIGILGSSPEAAIKADEPIAHGHKIALRPIAEGEAVVKYGVTIGFATARIAAGTWVHTHNCRSAIDERSHTLDPHSGAPTDTQYV